MARTATGLTGRAASPGGFGRGGAIEVTLADEGQDGVLRIRDNGIAPEMLPRVFDLFAQGDRELDRAPGGLGIGLTVVRRIVELHAGQLSLASLLGWNGGQDTIAVVSLSRLQSSFHAPSIPGFRDVGRLRFDDPPICACYRS